MGGRRRDKQKIKSHPPGTASHSFASKKREGGRLGTEGWEVCKPRQGDASLKKKKNLIQVWETWQPSRARQTGNVKLI